MYKLFSVCTDVSVHIISILFQGEPKPVYSVCPRRLDPFHIVLVTYYEMDEDFFNVDPEPYNLINTDQDLGQ